MTPQEEMDKDRHDDKKNDRKSSKNAKIIIIGVAALVLWVFWPRPDRSAARLAAQVVPDHTRVKITITAFAEVPNMNRNESLYTIWGTLDRVPGNNQNGYMINILSDDGNTIFRINPYNRIAGKWKDTTHRDEHDLDLLSMNGNHLEGDLWNKVGTWYGRQASFIVEPIKG